MPYPTQFPKAVYVYRTSPLRIRVTVWKRRPLTDGPDDEGLRRDLIADFGPDWACHIRPTLRAGRAVVCTVDPTDGATGVLLISATGADTALLDSGDQYGLDIRGTNEDGENSFIGKADVIVDGAYTRDD